MSPDLPQPRIGSEPLSGEQDFGPQGSGCLDVVKDNYKALASTQQEGVPQSWGTDNDPGDKKMYYYCMLKNVLLYIEYVLEYLIDEEEVR